MLPSLYPDLAEFPKKFYEWRMPDSYWWHSLSPAEQAAWAVVWATAIAGTLAAIGSFRAAWAAEAAARKALEIAAADREERRESKLATDLAANWRVALRLQLPFDNLLTVARKCAEVLQAGKTYYTTGRHGTCILGHNFGFTKADVGSRELARIGALDQHAGDVTGELGEKVLLALSYSRETAALTDRLITELTAPISVGMSSLDVLENDGLDHALTVCQQLIAYTESAVELISTTRKNGPNWSTKEERRPWWRRLLEWMKSFA